MTAVPSLDVEERRPVWVPPIPTGAFESLVVSERPLRYGVPW